MLTAWKTTIGRFRYSFTRRSESSSGLIPRFIIGWLVASLLLPVVPVHGDTQPPFSPGDRVLVAANVLPVHPKPDASSPVVGELYVGQWSKYLQSGTDAQNQNWLYLSANAYGWVQDTVDGQPAIIPFSNTNVAQQFTVAKAAIKAAPQNTNGYIGRAFGYEAQGKLALALADFNAAVKVAPQDGHVYALRGLFEVRHYQYQNAITDLLKAEDLGERTAMIYSGLCDAYLGIENNASATDYNSKALTIAPEWGLLVGQRGWLYHASQQYDRAVALAAQALTLDPLLTYSYIRRALAYRRQQHYEDFLNNLDAAIKLDPHCGDCYTWRGIYMNDDLAGDPGALAEFNNAINAEPYNSFGWENRGVWYVRNGNLRLAFADFRQALALEPSDATIYYNLASTYSSNGQYAASAVAYTTVIKLGGSYALPALLYRPQAYLALGQYDEALADIQSWLQNPARPDQPEFVAVADLVKGAAYLYKGDYANARTAYHDASAANPDFTLGYKSLGRGYRITPIRELLIAGLQTTAHAHPKDVKTLIKLGNIAMEFGYWPEGIKAYQSTLNLQADPDLSALVDDLTALFRI